MAWTPGEDPWGIAMLASGAALVTSLLLVNARRMAIRPRTGPVMMTGLAATAFLACAAMGALERVEQDAADSSTAEDPAGEPAAPEVSVDAAAADPDAPAEDDADSDDAPASVDAAPVRNAALDPVEPFPTGDAQRQTAVRSALRSARSVYESQRDCKDAKSVGQAWAEVAAIPKDARPSRVKTVARKLEACRKRVRGATAYSVRQDRVAARDAFKDDLKQRITDAHGITASIAVTGDGHQRLRVGSGSFDEAMAGTIVAQSLQDELTALGFERIVLAATKQSWRTDLEPRPESAYVADALTPYGLDAPLTLRGE